MRTHTHTFKLRNERQTKEININCVVLIIIECEWDRKSEAAFPLRLSQPRNTQWWLQPIANGSYCCCIRYLPSWRIVAPALRGFAASIHLHDWFHSLIGGCNSNNNNKAKLPRKSAQATHTSAKYTQATTTNLYFYFCVCFCNYLLLLFVFCCCCPATLSALQLRKHQEIPHKFNSSICCEFMKAFGVRTKAQRRHTVLMGGRRAGVWGVYCQMK